MKEIVQLWGARSFGHNMSKAKGDDKYRRDKQKMFLEEHAKGVATFESMSTEAIMHWCLFGRCKYSDGKGAAPQEPFRTYEHHGWI